MKKILTCLMVSLCLVLGLTACGTNNVSESNDIDLAGVWTYEEPNAQDPTLMVTFDLSEDGEFNLEVTKNVLEDDIEDNTAVVTGTYVDNGEELSLVINSVEGDSNIVKADDEVTLGYTLSGDSEALTVTGAEAINPDIPSSVELSRNNASN